MKILFILVTTLGGLGLMAGFACYYLWDNPGWITIGLITSITVTGVAWWRHTHKGQRSTPWCMSILGTFSLVGALIGKSRWCFPTNDYTELVDNPFYRFIGVYGHYYLTLIAPVTVICVIVAFIWAIVRDYRAWQRSV